LSYFGWFSRFWSHKESFGQEFLFLFENFLIVNQIDTINNEKFSKKVLAGREKGCTFAARK